MSRCLLLAIALLVLAATSLTSAQGPTCPDPNPDPQFTSTPDWAAPQDIMAAEVDLTDYPSGDSLSVSFTAVNTMIVDTLSVTAVQAGRGRIFVSGVQSGSQLVAEISGGDAPNNLVRYWLIPDVAMQAEPILQIAINELTGEVYGVGASQNIYQFIVDIAQPTTVIEKLAFQQLYFDSTDTSLPAAAPRALAFDSTGKMIVAVNSLTANHAGNAMLCVYTPATGGNPAAVAEISGSGFYASAPAARAYGQVIITSIFFRRGYLWAFDSQNGALLRTRYPYASFSSTSDFDNNPLIAVSASAFTQELANAIVHEQTGNVFIMVHFRYAKRTQTDTDSTLRTFCTPPQCLFISVPFRFYILCFSSPGGSSIVQYRQVGESIQSSPTESPCLPDAQTFIGQSSSALLALDDTASTPRLYALTLDGSIASFSSVTLNAPLPASAAGCLTPDETIFLNVPISPPTFIPPPSLDTLDEVQNFDAVATGIDFPTGELSRRWRWAREERCIVAGSDASGVTYVNLFTPGSSVDGSDYTGGATYSLVIVQ